MGGNYFDKWRRLGILEKLATMFAMIFLLFLAIVGAIIASIAMFQFPLIFIGVIGIFLGTLFLLKGLTVLLDLM